MSNIQEYNVPLKWEELSEEQRAECIQKKTNEYINQIKMTLLKLRIYRVIGEGNE